MKKTKKRNCKHGLDDNQEIQARRIKDILTGKVDKPEKKEEYIAKLKAMYEQCCQLNKGMVVFDNLFTDYLKEKDIVLYSAFVRAGYKVSQLL